MIKMRELHTLQGIQFEKDDVVKNSFDNIEFKLYPGYNQHVVSHLMYISEERMLKHDVF